MPQSSELPAVLNLAKTATAKFTKDKTTWDLLYKGHFPSLKKKAKPKKGAKAD